MLPNHSKFIIRILALCLCTFILSGCFGSLSKRPPAYGSIVEAFYVCEEKKLLVGGVWGKGPIRKFGLEDDSCWRNEWKELNRNEFKELATKWYGKNWANETPYWTRQSN